VRLLLDTNILVPLLDGRGRKLPEPYVELLRRDDARLFASVASVWEVAIKHSLGKLPLPMPIPMWPHAFSEIGITSLSIFTIHVAAELDTPYAGKDPFDRLLLGVCQSERLRLLTRDQTLLQHPLAWQPGSA